MIFCLFTSQFPSQAYRIYQHVEVAVVEQGKIISVPDSIPLDLVGIPKGQFSSLHPEVLLKIRDPHIEKAVWESIMMRLYDISPLLESPEVGLVYIQTSKSSERFIKQYATEFGLKAGGAQSKEHAFIAALKAVSGFLLHITKGNQEEFFRSCDGALLKQAQFSPKMIERLELLGYNTLKDITSLTKRQIQVQFKNEGIRLFELLHSNHKSIDTWFKPAPQLKISFDNDDDIKDVSMFEQWFTLASAELHKKLEGRVARAIELVFTYKSTPEQSRMRVFQDPVYHEKEIERAGLGVWRQCSHEEEIKRIQFRLKQLEVPVFEQQMLFHRPELAKAISRLQKRFPEALLRSIYRPHALFTEDQYELRKY